MQVKRSLSSRLCYRVTKPTGWQANCKILYLMVGFKFLISFWYFRVLKHGYLEYVKSIQKELNRPIMFKTRSQSNLVGSQEIITADPKINLDRWVNIATFKLNRTNKEIITNKETKGEYNKKYINSHKRTIYCGSKPIHVQPNQLASKTSQTWRKMKKNDNKIVPYGILCRHLDGGTRCKLLDSVI